MASLPAGGRRTTSASALPRTRAGITGQAYAACAELGDVALFETNEKDLVDIAALLCDHELTAGSDDGIDAHYVAALTAADWGPWRTATLVLERVAGYLRERPALAGAHANAEALSLRIEPMPKTRGWRLRARIGDRKRWYQLPEEKQ
jgi:hypothetical protein